MNSPNPVAPKEIGGAVVVKLLALRIPVRAGTPKVKHSLNSNDLMFGDWPSFYLKRAVEADLGAGTNPVPVSSYTMPYRSEPSSSVVP